MFKFNFLNLMIEMNYFIKFYWFIDYTIVILTIFNWFQFFNFYFNFFLCFNLIFLIEMIEMNYFFKY